MNTLYYPYTYYFMELLKWHENHKIYIISFPRNASRWLAIFPLFSYQARGSFHQLMQATVDI